MKHLIRAIAIALTTIMIQPANSDAGGKGADLYDACTSCHKSDGGGDVSLNVPAIAGMEGWYIKAQLDKFKLGQRAYHPDDFYGLRMRPMAGSIQDEADIETVIDYISKLPKVKASATLEGGDAQAGKAAYAVCVACHGVDGEGNEAVGGPALAGQADWYLKRQIEHYKSGMRGSADGDATGAVMAAMSQTLTTDAAVANVIAYILTL